MAKRRRVRIFKADKGPYSLIAGIDFDNPKANNVMGYLRSAKFSDEGEELDMDYPEFWLKIEEMDKLGMLLLLSARFWAKKREKKVSVEEVKSFKRFWDELQSHWPSIGKYLEEEDEDAD